MEMDEMKFELVDVAIDKLEVLCEKLDPKVDAFADVFGHMAQVKKQMQMHFLKYQNRKVLEQINRIEAIEKRLLLRHEIATSM